MVIKLLKRRKDIAIPGEQRVAQWAGAGEVYNTKLLKRCWDVAIPSEQQVFTYEQEVVSRGGSEQQQREQRMAEQRECRSWAVLAHANAGTAQLLRSRCIGICQTDDTIAAKLRQQS